MVHISSVISVTQSCLTLCHHMDCSTPGFPVHHQLPELAQTHAHWVGDAIQPSHLLSSPFPPAFNISQHQGLLQGVSSSHQVVKVLEFQLQHQSFSEYSGLISFSIDWFVLLAIQGTDKCLPTPQFKIISSSAAFFIVQRSYPYMTTGKNKLWLDGPLSHQELLTKIHILILEPFYYNTNVIIIVWFEYPPTGLGSLKFVDNQSKISQMLTEHSFPLFI